MAAIEKELERRFVESFALTTQEPKEVLDLQKKVAVNVALMELNRPVNLGGVFSALRNAFGYNRPMTREPDGELDDLIRDDRMQGAIQKMWAVIPKIYTGTDKPIQYTWNGSLKEAIEAMIALAAKEGKRVIAGDYYEVPFIISPQIRTVEEGKACVEVGWYDYHARIQERMKKEKFDVTGHSVAWEKRKQENPEIAAFAEQAAKRLQAEMSLSPNKELTLDMISRTSDFEEKYNHRTDLYAAGQILFECWKYGEEFAKLVKYPEDKLKELREKSKDEPSLKKTLNAGMKQDVRKRISSPENC